MLPLQILILLLTSVTSYLCMIKEYCHYKFYFHYLLRLLCIYAWSKNTTVTNFTSVTYFRYLLPLLRIYAWSKTTSVTNFTSFTYFRYLLPLLHIYAWSKNTSVTYFHYLLPLLSSVTSYLCMIKEFFRYKFFMFDAVLFQIPPGRNRWIILGLQCWFC